MSLYTYIPNSGDDDQRLILTERSIYGSSRVGTENINQVVAAFDPGYITINEENGIYSGVFNHYAQTIGDKRYELSNHLGNVLEVLTDRKLAIDQNTYDPITGAFVSATPDGVVDYYVADVVSQSDYYPFGMLLPNQNESTPEYRYGFNGMEKDDEVSGNGNSYDFGARLYNPRVGRWLSRDKNVSASIGVNPYHYVLNSPIWLLDLDGNVQRDFNGKIIVESTGKYVTMTHAGHPFNAEIMYVLADDGTKIMVYRNTDTADPRHNTNCHGTTFLDGEYWLNNEDVDLLIIHDGYQEITNPAEIQPDDVITFEKDPKDGGSDHSVNVVSAGKGKEDSVIEGLGGDETAVKRGLAVKAWDAGSTITVWRKTTPDVVQELNPSRVVVGLEGETFDTSLGNDNISGGGQPEVLILKVKETCAATGSSKIITVEEPISPPSPN